MASNGTVGRPATLAGYDANRNLQFETTSGAAIAVFDAANRVLSIPSGSLLRYSTAQAAVLSATLTTLSTQNVTPTAAQLFGGIVAHATTTAAGTFTLDTGAHIDAAVTSVANGDVFDVVVANTGSFTSTITTNTGLTLVGTVAIPSGKIACLTFFRTGTAAWTVYCMVSA